jgi:hypothetical protein
MLGQFSEERKKSQLHVLSANLFGVFDQPQQQQNPLVPPPAQKLVGIRIMGEILNTGKTIATEISPVVRFLDSDNNEMAKKIGRLTPGFDFFGVGPNGQTLYDVIIDDPPQADRMEVVLNMAGATTSARFDLLKILNQTIEVKKAVNQNKNNENNKSNKDKEGSESGQASGSAEPLGGPVGSEGEIIEPTDAKALVGEMSEIEYYTVSGSVVNSLSDPVSDVSVYVWVKDASGQVFSFGRQDFKGDLISPKKAVDFKINLLPFKDGEKMDKYEIRAWGRRYTL